jgi:nicotinate-nucleotide--dimethylbenzimidazole phosphoribosyltransferase
MTLQEIIAGVRPLDESWMDRAREHTAALAIPPRALGRLHDLSERICAIEETLTPEVDSKAFLVMAGDHGVAAEGVSAFPQEVTGEMAANFLRGGASINVLAREVGAEVLVVDMGIIPELDPAELEGGDRFLVRKIARGTANLAQGPAMTREQAEQAVLTGFEIASDLIAGGASLLGTGDMGIANTTPSAAVAVVLTGRHLAEMVGRGTGVDDEGLERKRGVIARGLEVNQPDPGDGLDVLAKVGGFEIGGLAGCVLAGAYHRRPVVIDGLISTAGALIAHALAPAAAGCLFAGHRSAEPAHQAMLERLGLEPVLDLGLRLGEGTGAALAMNIIQGAVRVFNDVFTFEQAGVSNAD